MPLIDGDLTFYSGSSMWPTLRPGDRLVIEPCDAGGLRPGEVVVFRSAGGELPGEVEARGPAGAGGAGARLVCHRVLGLEAHSDPVLVRTQGDCSGSPDLPWAADRLVGRVVAVDPVRGRTRRLAPAPFLGWRLRHRLSARRILRGLLRRARGALGG